jgi:hypothetical protein
VWIHQRWHRHRRELNLKLKPHQSKSLHLISYLNCEEIGRSKREKPYEIQNVSALASEFRLPRDAAIIRVMLFHWFDCFPWSVDSWSRSWNMRRIIHCHFILVIWGSQCYSEISLMVHDDFIRHFRIWQPRNLKITLHASLMEGQTSPNAK